jgi:hypothetical protein
LDAPATEASVEAHAYCAVDGIVERIPLRVLSGPERQAVLAQRRALGYDYLRLLFKNGLILRTRVRNRSMEQRDDLLEVVRCQRRLPPATQVLLHWGAGIATASGLVTHTDQQLAFRVRAAFTAQVECTRATPRAGCMPVLPIMVNFSAPVPRAQALAIRLKAADGHLLAPQVPPGAQQPTLEGVSFPGPFAESSTLSVILPGALTDDAGRALTNAARFPLDVRVDAYPPLVKFSGDFGILEAREGGILPVTLRNVEPTLAARQSSLPATLLRVDTDPRTIADWLRRVQEAGRPRGEWVDATEASAVTAGSRPRRVWRDQTGDASVFSASDAVTAFTVTKPAGSRPEEVVGIPLRRPGSISSSSPATHSAWRCWDRIARATSPLRRWSPTWQCISSGDARARWSG